MNIVSYYVLFVKIEIKNIDIKGLNVESLKSEYLGMYWEMIMGLDYLEVDVDVFVLIVLFNLIFEDFNMCLVLGDDEFIYILVDSVIFYY